MYFLVLVIKFNLKLLIFNLMVVCKGPNANQTELISLTVALQLLAIFSRWNHLFFKRWCTSLDRRILKLLTMCPCQTDGEVGR